MAKQRLLTKVLRHIFVVLPLSSPKYGPSGCHGPSIGTTPLSMSLQRPPLLRLCMEDPLLLSSNLFRVRSNARQWHENSLIGTKHLSNLSIISLESRSGWKKPADKHRRDEELYVGDWVFLKLRPHKQQSVVRRINQKLAPCFYGPFLITHIIGQVAYKLQPLPRPKFIQFFMFPS